MLTRLAEVSHLDNRHQGSNITLRRHNNNNNINNNRSNSNSSNNTSNNKRLTMGSTVMTMVTRLWREPGTCVMRVRMVRRWDPGWDRVS